MSLENKQIRAQLLASRWALQPGTKTKYDHQIYLKVLAYLKEQQNNKYIALYWPMENEVDTIAIASELLRLGRRVCIPFINRNKMVFKPITTIHFEYDYWKSMRQPITKEIVGESNIAIMIIPMIGYSTKRHRLGYGFNYYNDFLHQSHKIHTIGLAYKFQYSNLFKSTPYDKILNMVITN